MPDRKPTIHVRPLNNGDRRVVVTVPLDLCIAAVGFMTGDPVAQADGIAKEIAMHALMEDVGHAL